MNDQILQFPRFFLTAPGPCPYLPGRVERKVFTELRGLDASSFNEALGRMGFRRSQNVAYRPACDRCCACQSVRVRADAFKPSGTMRKVLRRNGDLLVSACEPWATAEQFDLLQRYLHARHPEGGMTQMDADDYADMVERTPVDTVVYEYREPSANGPDADGGGRLVGVCLTDHHSDGLSMVYSFFEPDGERQSLGTYIILDHIRRAAELSLPYVYLGYWIPNCRQMTYKIHYKPLDVLTASGWIPIEELETGEHAGRPSMPAMGHYAFRPAEKA
ncbi:arginyltransferase [Pedomonas mirosovicensis]|uniref:arginyltransferase n=1 Tax=Pedomonas mirosovicensis TaxID=2908641 RepID=UPI002169168E|nr:arginyltransferase [Pedomonas mirosovicensis]MCH8685470.1 arginyltransferase [Pedomonas mirosovicensis]